jgi:hypothetical protein
MEQDVKTSMEKLGEALYIRAARKKQAEDAGKAVEYLEEQEVLDTKKA